MLEKLQIAKYDLALQATTPMRLPAFAGSTLRGAFGATFKGMVCIERHGDCPRCLLRKQCAYPYIFETWIEHGEGARKEVARPFVIEPPDNERRNEERRANDKGRREAPGSIDDSVGYVTLSPGDEIGFSLILFGKAIEYLPYFILTFREAGQRGLGAGRGQCELTTVEAVHPISGESRPIYDGAEGRLLEADLSVRGEEIVKGFGLDASSKVRRLSVEFQTYTRLMHLDHYVDRIEFHILIARLLGRLEALCEVHGPSPSAPDSTGPVIGARDLIVRAREVRLSQSDHCWHDWERYSSRQKTKVLMGGVLGSAIYEADSPEALFPYLPLLKLGELTHVGKGCVFGMGKIAASAVE